VTSTPLKLAHGNPSHLFALVAGGLLCVNDRVELKLDLPPASSRAMLGLLAGGFDVERLSNAAGLRDVDAAEAFDALDRHGLLSDRPPAAPPAVGVPLADALLAAKPPAVTWTSSELLVMPDDERAARRALNAFVGGLEPPGRVAAYEHLARERRRTTWGDIPDDAAVREALTRADRGGVVVVNLRDGRVTTVAADRVDRIGAGRPHRLGTVPSVEPIDPGALLRGLRHVYRGRWASRGDGGERAAYGIARTAEQAALIARAEAVERYALRAVDPRRLRRARAAELPGALDAECFYRPNERQRSDRDDERARLWAPVEDRAGATCWVAAELVHCPFADPDGGPLRAQPTSSGVAAHIGRGAALAAAARELVERDAFMWTWIQRVSRERIAVASLPDPTRALARRIERRGYAVDLVNLTLDSSPVVLAALHRDDRLLVAAACRDDGAAAASRALDEAALALRASDARRAPALAPQEVREPVDHLLLHLQPEYADHARFLVASGDEIAVGDVAAGGDAGWEVLAADLTSDATQPFSVVRALIPGLIPISFGWDREPLGMPRAAEPKITAGGRRVGAPLDLTDAGPLVPHPLP